MQCQLILNRSKIKQRTHNMRTKPELGALKWAAHHARQRRRPPDRPVSPEGTPEGVDPVFEVLENVLLVQKNMLLLSENMLLVQKNMLLVLENVLLVPENMLLRPENVLLLQKNMLLVLENVLLVPENVVLGLETVVWAVVTPPEGWARAHRSQGAGIGGSAGESNAGWMVPEADPSTTCFQMVRVMWIRGLGSWLAIWLAFGARRRPPGMPRSTSPRVRDGRNGFRWCASVPDSSTGFSGSNCLSGLQCGQSRR